MECSRHSVCHPTELYAVHCPTLLGGCDFTQSATPSAARVISDSSGNVGAMRMVLSSGSRPYGCVAPAGVSSMPASLARVTTPRAQPAGTSRLMKYPPLGLV